jgi:hypothetical protein
MSTAGKLIVPEQRSRGEPQPVTQQSAILAMISRANENPDINIDKMERLYAMYEKAMIIDKETAFNAAMTQAQMEMAPIAADATNPQTRSKYASYAQLDRAVRPIYTRHGFALSFDEGECAKPEYVRVLCQVSHGAGFSRIFHTDMPADGKGAKGGDVMSKTHAVGAAKSYGMRYLLRGIFNLAVGEEDKDGNDETAISEQQVQELRKLLTETNSNEERFLRTIKAQSLESIRAGAYSTVVGLIEAKRRRQ